MTALTVEQRDELAERLASTVVPHLTYAVHMRDADTIADLLVGLDRQELMALAVAIADRCPRPLMRPDDGLVDDIAVRRACAGERIPLTGPERLEAVRVLRGRGHGRCEVARLLNLADTSAARLIARVDAEGAA